MADKGKIVDNTVNIIKEFYASVMQDKTLSIEDRMIAAEKLKELLDEESR